eukprot:TRINITY_DN4896_c0_g1_i4.p1 TRINITY_DN4896_c0_g1~~TRINITY_DN4896_c0_g1_i4.p1  ORF type:complete len:351 (+),score=65.85 TRINITY_DN4896_c0_g1_i4:38-1054(+)
MLARRILSGIQPSGALHLGNYLGALQNWRALQDAAPPASTQLFCVVDLHALTSPATRENPAQLRSSIREVAVHMLAAGIDPARSAVFQQSAVPAHSELAWILSCLVPHARLQRMHHWKDKTTRQDGTLGLLSYPCLMAADILLYRATHVPVGEDQQQHIELTRELCHAFTSRYQAGVAAPLLVPPEALFTTAKRVMSLRDAASKMSKSDPSDGSRINMSDPDDTIMGKIRRAKTDSLPTIGYDPSGRPDVSNLVDIFAYVTQSTPEAVVQQHSGLSCSEFKVLLAEAVVALVRPHREEAARLRSDQAYIDQVLEAGAQTARGIANETLQEVKQLVGFL